MKFLMYSESGEGAQILKRIELEGNEVGLYINDPIYKTVFDGILEKVNPKSFVDKETVVIFDISGNGDIADEFRKQGHFVYGSSCFADKLEQDRQFGFDAMKEAGIKIPEHKEFTSFEDGRKFVRETNKRLVFKPSGSMPCKLTYVSQNSKELIAYLYFVEKQFGKDIDSFILQDFIEGCVVSSELFFSNGKRVLQPNHTVEVKKVMNDDLGPSAGCSGNITWPCDEDRIIKDGVALIEDICGQENYTGQMDLNAVVNERGIFGLEWTPRFGYDATPTLLTLLQDDFGAFFSGLARGEGIDFKFDTSYAGGVRVSIPPYPAEPKAGIDTEKFSPNEDIPIQEYEEFCEDLYFYEVKMEDNNLCHSGGTGVIACAMGVGKSPEESLSHPYKILEKINIPDKQYRTDLDKVLPKMIKEIECYAA